MSLLNNILFLDIETVPQYDCYGSLPEEWKPLWDSKAAYMVRNREGETAETVYNRAGIYAEFGKIICICAGYISGTKEKRTMRIKAFAGDVEKNILIEFSAMLKSFLRPEINISVPITEKNLIIPSSQGECSSTELRCRLRWTRQGRSRGRFSISIQWSFGNSVIINHTLL